ncbi:hypothetical protein EE612_000571 [Oryza sativa]|nr:hypothetical protein EE612_000571 [Oryza sativa]
MVIASAAFSAGASASSGSAAAAAADPSPMALSLEKGRNAPPPPPPSSAVISLGLVSSGWCSECSLGVWGPFAAVSAADADAGAFHSCADTIQLAFSDDTLLPPAAAALSAATTSIPMFFTGMNSSSTSGALAAAAAAALCWLPIWYASSCCLYASIAANTHQSSLGLAMAIDLA